ncbi:MAG: DNA translocase FtsK 4TM domain-containing protein [Deltaproteobacteria bacterium]|nr:DNA translocase FtsK 4TM domain-containing protein [Deltaproteobacteria bacterium]
MLLNKSASQGPASPSINKGSVLWQETRRLLCLGAALFICMALLSYRPSDPSWSTFSSQDLAFGNWMGRTGAALSDLLFQLLGLAAFTAPVLVAFFAFRKSRPLSKKVEGAGILVLVLAISSLLCGLLEGVSLPWGMSKPGGLVGHFFHSSFVAATSRMGSLLISSLALLIAIIAVFQWQLFSHMVSVSKRLYDFAFRLLRKLIETLPSWSKRFKKEAAPKITTITETEPVMATAPIPREAQIELKCLPVAKEGSFAQAPFSMTEEPFCQNGILQLKPTTTERPSETKAQKPVHRAKKHQDFQLPNISLLSGRAESKVKSVDRGWFVEKANILVQKLKDFGVDGEVVNISPGPVITVYEFKPASGVKIKEIANLSDDLTLALSVLSVRIVAPIPGKPVVGIEIPSPHREMVFFKDMIQETPFYNSDVKLPILLGRLASGEPVAADLASMPHLLIAGTTGTGKSVFVNTLIGSLLYRFSPVQLRLLLVDPKMVELCHYEGIPHLLLPVVVDSKKAVLALRWTVDEMERRYNLMHEFGVRHVDVYNARISEIPKDDLPEGYQHLPYIVVVIDEYADLMAVVPKEVELSIARLAQKARASGIHLVLATQRPSTDVVTGTIKANFPSRISFRVASSVDSKTILDRTGADRLLGNGDLLFHSAGFTTLKRMQGPFISDEDIERVVEFLKEQGQPEYDESILQPREDENEQQEFYSDGRDDERLYSAAVRLVTERGEASISLIQRHLRIGYNRAATLMEQLEKQGVVGQSQGPVKRRTVLLNT